MSEDDLKLRKMNRAQLIEIIYALQQNEQKILSEMEQMNQQLQNRGIAINNAGSIAEASLNLSGIFEDAQRAADEYLSSVREMNEQAYKANSQAVQQAEMQAAQIMHDTQFKADEIMRQACMQADAIVNDAKSRAAQYIMESQQGISAMYAQAESILQNIGSIAGATIQVNVPPMPPLPEAAAQLQPQAEPMAAGPVPMPNFGAQVQPMPMDAQPLQSQPIQAMGQQVPAQVPVQQVMNVEYDPVVNPAMEIQGQPVQENAPAEQVVRRKKKARGSGRPIRQDGDVLSGGTVRIEGDLMAQPVGA